MRKIGQNLGKLGCRLQFSKNEGYGSDDSDTTIIASVYELATLRRQIAPLCMAFDMDEYIEGKTSIEVEVFDWAYRVYRYSDAYGFRSEASNIIKIK